MKLQVNFAMSDDVELKKVYILNILLKSFEEKVKSILTEKYFIIFQYREILEISGI